MHIEEGVLVASSGGWAILAGGAALAAAGTLAGLRKTDYERVPQVAMLSAAFFVASLIHVPIGTAPVHLLLTGLVGLLLGWAAFPAILIALFLQAVCFGFGGLLTLGVNTVTMAAPAVIVGGLFNGLVRSKSDGVACVAAFAAGALGVLLSLLLWATAMTGARPEFLTFSKAAVVAHLALAPIEGLVTASAVAFLRKVRPELLEAPLLPAPVEVSDA